MTRRRPGSYPEEPEAVWLAVVPAAGIVRRARPMTARRRERLRV